ncbi:ATP-binding protein [Erythrobacteraceae bacterium WH01K]|nr:ATP-binding protein [Erythrobacteraceae bacterium WH01K]
MQENRVQDRGWTKKRADRPSNIRAALTALAWGVLFGCLAYASIETSRGSGRIAAVWVPNAFAIAYLLRRKRSLEPMLYACLFAGSIAANLAVGDTLAKALALSSANSIEIFLAVTLVRRLCGPTADMRDIRALIMVALLAGTLAPLASALVATAALFADGAAPVAGFLKWWLTDALGIVILTPCLLVIADSLSRPRWPDVQERRDWLLLTTLGTGATVAVFAQNGYPLLFLVLPVIVLYAFRLGNLGTAFSTIKVSVIATVFTWNGQGPITLIDGGLTEQLIVLQAFIASAFLIGLPVAAVLHGRRQMTEALAARREELDLLTSNISDAILRFDADGICTYVSPSVADVLGAGPEEFLGQKTTDRMHDEARETILAAHERLMSGQSAKERFTYRRLLDDENGSPVFIEADCVVAKNPVTGSHEGILFSARDVTDRVILERQLVRARRHAENAARAKSEFLANMSHEIRTPMNGVLGFAELLRKADLQEEERRYANLIYESGRSMMLLLNDILDISKIEAGQIVITPENVDVSHLLQGCVRLHAAHAQQKDIALSASVEPGLPPEILIDQLRLRQIILNLIGNAVKFTETGRISVTARAAKSELVVAVKDTGIGISRERLDDIFNPFQQADGKTSRKYGGTGLGLSISRQLAELLGGTLSCSSTPGAGSCFTLRVPLVCARERSIARPEDAAPSPEPILRRDARILLAEDHDVNRLLVGAMLERCGLTPDIAVDGAQAVEKVLAARAGGAPYDLVLMDVQMPGMDGYAATRRIRADGIDGAALPIIALTANAFPEDIAASQQAGMQSHLAKPLVFGELLKALHRWLPASADEAGATLSFAPRPSPVAESARERWLERRREAVEAVRALVAQDRMDDRAREDLARIVHKLAGTAGMFGEDELGQHAGALERALKSGEPVAASRQIARQLLQAA